MTDGIPRLINVLCDRCLLGTYVQDRETVNTATLDKAGEEVFGNEKSSPFSARPIFMWLLIIIVLGSATAFFSRDRISLLINSKNIAAVEPAIKNTKPYSPTGKPPTAQSEQRQLVWPADIPKNQSLTLGYMKLFHLWGKNYETESSLQPCQQAEQAGLQCLQRQGSLGGLVHLDRPALLKVVDSDGIEFYAPLVSIDEESVLFSINGNEVVLPTTVLDRQWFGSYTILWQPPEGFFETIKPDSDTENPWLREKLAKIYDKDLAGIELKPLVRDYQRREGLVADGIVGPETIIHINSSTGNISPSLKGK